MSINYFFVIPFFIFFFLQLKNEEDQYDIPSKRVLPYIVHKRMPYVVHKRMPYVVHKRMPYVVHKRMPYVVHKRMPYVVHKRNLGMLGNDVMSEELRKLLQNFHPDSPRSLRVR